MSSFCNTLWCEGKQILVAGSWMLDETRNAFVFYLSSIEHPASWSLVGLRQKHFLPLTLPAGTAGGL